MGPKAEEFLNVLLWSAETLARPTWRNLTESYEAWAYRSGLMREVARLEKRGWLERGSNEKGDRLYRLSEQGRVLALGGRDPEVEWSREWDGQWRLALFDVPNGRNKDRDRLRRYLRKRHFGCLQQSVWVTPNKVQEERQLLESGPIHVDSFILLEGRPCAGETDAEIVSGAWDFKRINDGYAKYMQFVKESPRGRKLDEKGAGALQRWGVCERQMWLEAVSRDPLLPKKLLPARYLGCTAWSRRISVLQGAGEQIRSFRGPKILGKVAI